MPLIPLNTTPLGFQSHCDNYFWHTFPNLFQIIHRLPLWSKSETFDSVAFVRILWCSFRMYLHTSAQTWTPCAKYLLYIRRNVILYFVVFILEQTRQEDGHQLCQLLVNIFIILPPLPCFFPKIFSSLVILKNRQCKSKIIYFFSYLLAKFFFKNWIFPILNSESGVITITPKNHLWVGDTEKFSVAFSRAWLIPVEFS